MSEGRAPTATPTGKNDGAIRLDLSELENQTEGGDGGSSLTSGLFVTSKSNGKDSTKKTAMSLTLPAGRTQTRAAPPRSDTRSKGPGEPAAPSGHALLPLGLRPAPKVRGASEQDFSSRNATGTQVNPAEDSPRTCPQKPRGCAPSGGPRTKRWTTRSLLGHPWQHAARHVRAGAAAQDAAVKGDTASRTREA